MIPRFFCPPAHARLAPGARFVLPADVAHHALRVLRLRGGAEIILFDGCGGEWRARIGKIGPGAAASVEVIEFLSREVESPLAVTLIQGLPESAEKMDWIVEKAVELGATAIQPVAARRSIVRLSAERMEKRRQHWQAVAIAACAQCGRNRVPEVRPLLPLFDLLASLPTSDALRLLLSPQGATTLAALPQPSGEALLLVGPEGGLSEEEVAAAQRVGFLSIRLGPRTLRTETAGMAMLAALQTLWGDFRQEQGDVRDG